jgi:hypothetical protein
MQQAERKQLKMWNIVSKGRITCLSNPQRWTWKLERVCGYVCKRLTERDRGFVENLVDCGMYSIWKSTIVIC